ncbi:MAG: OsmC family protein [Pseudomonadota bacterium]
MSDVETIKNALDRATKTVTLRPERGQRVYRNVATLTSGTQCAIEEAGQNLTLDVGQSLGGDNAGPTPSMVLRSAMSGCVAIGIKQWAARRGVPIDQLEVVLETDVDARGQLGVRSDIAPGFEGVRLSITVSSPASPELIDDVVRTSLQYSPLMDVFLNRQEVEHRISVVNADMNVAAAGDR